MYSFHLNRAWENQVVRGVEEVKRDPTKVTLLPVSSITRLAPAAPNVQLPTARRDS